MFKNKYSKYKYITSSRTLYNVWIGIKRRCYETTHKDYHRYGNKGVIVCNEWLDNFDNFAKFAYEKGWKKGLHTDRINPYGNYDPNNVRFVSCKMNSRNRRNTKLSQPLADYIRIIDASVPKLNKAELSRRLNINAVSIRQIVRCEQWY